MTTFTTEDRLSAEYEPIPFAGWVNTKPLTHDEIFNIFEKCGWQFTDKNSALWVIKVARAIEEHHGIMS